MHKIIQIKLKIPVRVTKFKIHKIMKTPWFKVQIKKTKLNNHNSNNSRIITLINLLKK